MDDDTWGMVRRAEALIAARRAPDAIRLLASVSGPDAAPRVLGVTAQAHLALGQYERVLDLAGRALVLEPEDEWLHRLAARGASGLERHDEARASARQALVLAPDSQDALLHVALIDVAAGRVDDESRGAIDRALTLAPEDRDALSVAARIAVHDRDVEAVQRITDRMLALDPTDSGAHRYRADVTQLVRPGTAWREFVTAARLAPGKDLEEHAKTSVHVAVMRGRGTIAAGAGLVLVALVLRLGGHPLPSGTAAAVALLAVLGAVAFVRPLTAAGRSGLRVAARTVTSEPVLVRRTSLLLAGTLLLAACGVLDAVAMAVGSVSDVRLYVAIVCSVLAVETCRRGLSFLVWWLRARIALALGRHPQD